MTLSLDHLDGYGFIKADGLSLEYQWLPPRKHGKPTLVLLHEGLGCVALWKDFPQQLATATGMGVFVFSRAGYGKSVALEDSRRSTQYLHHQAQQVLPEILAQLEIEEFILVGHSDGASLSIIYAGSDCCASGLQAVILMAPHVFNERVCVAGVREARVAYQQTDLKVKLAKYHGEKVDWVFHSWNDTWLSSDFWHWNIEEYLPRIKAPVLVLQGKDDHYGSMAQIDAIESQVPGKLTRIDLDQCAHSPHREQAQITVAAITEFVRS